MDTEKALNWVNERLDNLVNSQGIDKKNQEYILEAIEVLSFIKNLLGG